MNLSEWVFRCTGYAIGMMLGTTIDYFLFQLLKIQFPILLLGAGMAITTMSIQTIRYRATIFGDKPE